MTLEELRAQLNDLDRQLLELVANRQAVVSEIGRVKRDTGTGTRDFSREREVLLKARENAARLGVAPALGEALLQLLIRSSLTTQEQERVVAQGRGSGRAALVIGGAGKMGRWFADFLASQGFRVTVADPSIAELAVANSASTSPYEYLSDWRQSTLQEELIVVATPIKIANLVLEQLAERKPSGVVFDIGSVKSPLRSGLSALQRAGVKVTSVHPMYGPDSELLSGRHVIFIDLGSAAALAVAQEIFASTMAERIVMSLDEHDRLIAYVLGLSHALNIAFFTALAESGEAALRLRQLSSTTFDAQVNVASRVAQENPAMYFEIQKLNDYGLESLDALRRAIERVQQSVTDNDADAFAALMNQGREYFVGRVTES